MEHAPPLPRTDLCDGRAIDLHREERVEGDAPRRLDALDPARVVAGARYQPEAVGKTSMPVPPRSAFPMRAQLA